MSLSRGAIVLCGGRSRRMGCDKASLPFGPDETMLQRVVRLIGEAVPAERIVCVAAANQILAPLPSGVRILRDSVPHQGPLACLVTGLRALRNGTDAVFACGCDTPLLQSVVISLLFERLGIHQVAALADGERIHPLAAVYRVSILAAAESLFDSGERSLAALVSQCNARHVSSEELKSVDPDLDSIASCNTPREYERALKLAYPPG